MVLGFMNFKTIYLWLSLFSFSFKKAYKCLFVDMGIGKMIPLCFGVYGKAMK